MKSIGFESRVVVISGAGRGLGRSYALEIARRGGAVVVNDLGAATDGSKAAAENVVEEITTIGGRAVADYNSVASEEGAAAVIQTALNAFGKVDVVINNAGFLRDMSLIRMTSAQFESVLDVHLRGSFYLSKPAFAIMKTQGYGRFVFTSSAAGLFGNFGQANYAAAKMGVVGLSNIFAIEGFKSNIKSNVIAPGAKTRLTEFAGPLVDGLPPECVAPMVAYLASEQCQETQNVYSVGGGRFARIFIGATPGWSNGLSVPPSVEEIAAHMEAINSLDDFIVPRNLKDEGALLEKALKRS
jgi:NAD(P)-dependent dehydrogenase (short-subunit alcohol dehydrogenase family)